MRNYPWPKLILATFGLFHLSNYLEKRFPRPPKTPQVFTESQIAWTDLKAWFRNHTPRDSSVFLPFDLPMFSHMSFMVQAERSAMPGDLYSYASILGTGGQAALPFIHEAEKLGYRFKDVGSDEEAATEIERLKKVWARGRIAPLARKIGITHIVAARGYDPFDGTGRRPVYRNKVFKVYRIKPQPLLS